MDLWERLQSKEEESEMILTSSTTMSRVKLEDFVIPAKIEAFCDQYEPHDHHQAFFERRLETFFARLKAHT